MMASFRLVIGVYRAIPAARRVQAPPAVIHAGLDSGVALVTTRVLKGVLELNVTNITEHAHVEQAIMVNNVTPSAGIVAKSAM